MKSTRGNWRAALAATPGITFMDTWHDTLTGNNDAGYSVATAGSFSIKFSTHDYARVTLQVATDTNLTDTNAGVMTGFVDFYQNSALTNELYSSAIDAKLAVSSAVAGSYNFAINPVSSDPSQGPGGYSPGIAIISKKEAGSMSFAPADGISAAISFSTDLARDGTCPIYAALYGGNGVLLRWLGFDTDVSGSVDWLTAFDFKSSVYTNDFNANCGINGQLYIAPRPGTNVMGWTNGGEFIIDYGYTDLNLPDETDIPPTFNPARNSFSDTGSVAVSFKPANGTVSGTLPQGKKKPLFRELSSEALDMVSIKAPMAGRGRFKSRHRPPRAGHPRRLIPETCNPGPLQLSDSRNMRLYDLIG